MAVSKVPLTSKIILKVPTGTNGSGHTVYKQRAFAGLKATAVDSDVFAVAQEIGNLQQYTPFVVVRLDEGTLANA